MSQSFLDKVAEIANKAGTLARQGSDAAYKAYKDLEPGINAAIDYAKTVTDKERRTQAIDQLKQVADRVVANGSKQLQHVLIQVQEGFNGVPSDVAALIATYATLAEAAEAKGALGLPEMIACTTKIESIKKKLADDPKADVKSDAEALDALVRTAGSAVANFASDAPSVAALILGCRSTVSDISYAEGDLAQATTDYIGKIKGASAPAPLSGLSTLTELESRLADAETDNSAGNYAAAAIKLSHFGVDAAALLAATQNGTEDLKKLIGEPARTLRLLRLLRDGKYHAGALTIKESFTADERLKVKAMVGAYEAAKAKLLETPCDMPEARRAFEYFEEISH